MEQLFSSELISENAPLLEHTQSFSQSKHLRLGKNRERTTVNKTVYDITQTSHKH